jgi:hypothetical protein
MTAIRRCPISTRWRIRAKPREVSGHAINFPTFDPPVYGDRRDWLSRSRFKSAAMNCRSNDHTVNPLADDDIDIMALFSGFSSVLQSKTE